MIGWLTARCVAPFRCRPVCAALEERVQAGGHSEWRHSKTFILGRCAGILNEVNALAMRKRDIVLGFERGCMVFSSPQLGSSTQTGQFWSWTIVS